MFVRAASRLGLGGIPVEAETIMLERDMRLVKLTGARYHAASVTCAESLEVLRRAKEAGMAVTASASINHLALNENFRHHRFSFRPNLYPAT